MRHVDVVPHHRPGERGHVPVLVARLLQHVPDRMHEARVPLAVEAEPTGVTRPGHDGSPCMSSAISSFQGWRAHRSAVIADR
jgi:hypothetical protein